MITLSAHYYEAKRAAHGWQPVRELNVLPLLQFDNTSQRAVMDAFCEGRYLIGKTRPPRQNEIAYLHLKAGTRYSARVDTAERKLGWAGLDMVVGEFPDERILWDAALGMTTQQGRQDEAKQMFVKLSQRSPIPAWDYAKSALSLGLTVKAQSIEDDPAIEMSDHGDLIMSIHEDEAFYIPEHWPTHHLYIQDDRTIQS